MSETLYWFAKYLYQVDDVSQLLTKEVFTSEEVALIDKARMHLWTVRCQLHYLTARLEERLTFDVQPQLWSYPHSISHLSTDSADQRDVHSL